MFTGLIEETGIVKRMKRGRQSIVLTIEANKVLSDVKPGDSICTNGVCLTVTSHTDKEFSADVMPETMDRTNFKSLTVGSYVNLERAMLVGSRFGGHIVSGHIDGTGAIVKRIDDDNALRLTITAGPQVLRYVIEKGSVAIDGISLTVTSVSDRDFEVSVIPMTAKETTLLDKGTGDMVNLECDVVGKYIERFATFKTAESRISMDFLKDYGFL
ncbi:MULTISPECIES: riboflavin synthase [unclassified Fusibacter]|uniref:riboflavin synthase n=1 Tax=unclassified Fusibacter TaxID=2624464 RepID=UPI0010111650|nr:MULTISPECIES: riboflavin synthase [unclassified Fusibacter]MCK8060343.1 riboflavin synthase [Fusibacter sp. A2]NPE20368.1 riboflavin synthase [Fusibacter sp. A1]RXV63574.1 riboflavin synthase [Fusibacter sp. A1]